MKREKTKASTFQAFIYQPEVEWLHSRTVSNVYPQCLKSDQSPYKIVSLFYKISIPVTFQNKGKDQSTFSQQIFQTALQTKFGPCFLQLHYVGKIYSLVFCEALNQISFELLFVSIFLQIETPFDLFISIYNAAIANRFVTEQRDFKLISSLDDYVFDCDSRF